MGVRLILYIELKEILCIFKQNLTYIIKKLYNFDYNT